MDLLITVVVCVFILPFLAAIVMVGGLVATALTAGFLYAVMWLGQAIGGNRN